MHRLASALICACPLLSLAATTSAQESTAEADPVRAIIGEHQRPFMVSEAGLDGPGAEFIIDEAGRAQFVLIGEEHGTRETPAFAAHLMQRLAPVGFDVFCMEIDLPAATRLSALLDENDPLEAIARHNRAYPMAIAFYNWKEECEALIAAHEAGYTLWGLDQAFAASGRVLLERLVDLAPDQEARALADAWKDKAWAGFELFRTQGRHDRTFLMVVKPEDFDRLDAAFTDAPDQARVILRELRESAHVYQLYMQRREYETNHDRIELMKRHFHQYVDARGGHDHLPRAVFKFGDMHMGRGYSPLNQLDLGNMAAEMACAEGRDSLHIRVFARTSIGPDGAKTDAVAAQPQLAAVLEAGADDGWTVVDLRPLRPYFQRAKNREGREQLSDLVWRYDVAVVAPEFHAATDVVPLSMPN